MDAVGREDAERSPGLLDSASPGRPLPTTNMEEPAAAAGDAPRPAPPAPAPGASRPPPLVEPPPSRVHGRGSGRLVQVTRVGASARPPALLPSLLQKGDRATFRPSQVARGSPAPKFSPF